MTRALIVVTGLIVAIVVPWTSFEGHTHWDRVQWIPFRPPPAVSLTDVGANLLLYVPFGFFGRGSVWVVVGLAAGLSLATEWSQLYSHGRFPTATDLLMNVTGASIGWWLAARRRAGGVAGR